MKAAKAALLKMGYGGIRIEFLTCAELSAGDYEVQYLIENALVKGQPCILAGQKKTLKTSLAIALAIALATGLAFLDHFAIKRICKVLILSGESGMATLRDTARRICKSLGISFEEIENLYWGDFLPKLDEPTHLDALSRAIDETGCEVCILDPCYLMMPASDSGNLHAQGERLRRSERSVPRARRRAHPLSPHAQARQGKEPARF